MMYEMKGEEETVMVGELAGRGRIELTRFADGSWAIRKGGAMMGVWEPHEREECLRVFNMLAGVGGALGKRMRGVADGETEGTNANWN